MKYICTLVSICLLGFTCGKILPEYAPKNLDREFDNVPFVGNEIGLDIQNTRSEEAFDFIDNTWRENNANENTVDLSEENFGNTTNAKKPNKYWILLTSKYTKKLRKTDFENFVFEEDDIKKKISLKASWRKNILKALSNGNLKVKPSISRPTLKSSNGNELTILSNDVTLKSSVSRDQPRTNLTCSTEVRYNCTLSVTRRRIVPCWWAPERQCYQNQPELRRAICIKRVPRCCRGYVLGRSGYCEIPAPVTIAPTPPSTTQTRATAPALRLAPTRSTIKTCGGILKSQEGVFTSPNYPQYYPDKSECTWRIQGLPGSKVILKVVDLSMEDPVGACDLRTWNCFELCTFDVLKIHDVTTGGTKSLCGYQSPTSQFVSSGNAIDVILKTDASTGGKGFKIVYAIVSEYDISTFHNKCTRGKTWQICRERCARTCQRYSNSSYTTCIDGENRRSVIKTSRKNEITCIPGCACPEHAPIWHNGECVKPESCPNDFFKCGKPAVTSKLKIVGGRTAGKYAWPWMAQIESELIFHICGATLICSNWVITASHCFLNMESTALDLNPRRYLVNVGKYWRDDQEDGRIVQTFEPEQIVIHPGYEVDMKSKVDNNDIALIKLNKAVDVTDYVRPVCLPVASSVTSEYSQSGRQQEPKTGTSCTVLGWGTTRNIGPTYERLKEASISVQPGHLCDYERYVWRLMICAGGHKDEDTCRGDSGGPFLCKRDNTWFLDGITSFGESCGDKLKAGGYTRVSSYISWIKSYTGDHCQS